MNRTLYFGADLDGPLVTPQADALGTFYAGPRKLLRSLEQAAGLEGYPEGDDYLRIELYRQALLQYGTGDTHAFFAASFAADRFATATTLLAWRDQLILAGWDFLDQDSLPERLRVLAGVERIFQQKAQDPTNALRMAGAADRWVQVLQQSAAYVAFDRVFIAEPADLYPPHVQRWLAGVAAAGVLVKQMNWTPQALSAGGLLLTYQQYLLGAPASGVDKVDEAEIILLHARTDTDAAIFLAQTLSRNPDWRPAFLIPELNQDLELAFMQEGLPPFGVLSATLARPALQVLKLAPAFLWEPVDIFKMMEFVTLPIKPLDRGLALEIARVLAERPGMFSDQWFGAVLSYLEADSTDPKAREQYAFWFQRRRYRAEAPAPKRDAIALYAYLQEWAAAYFEQSGSKDTTLLILADQARRIRELLETLPETSIGMLELERIVRTVVEPSPTQFADTAEGHYPFVHQAGALLRPVDELVWWNCLFENDAPPADFWQTEERDYLAARSCAPDDPRRQSKLRLLTRIRPILQTRRRLWLVLPTQTGGVPAVHSLLVSDLQALFPQIATLHFDLQDAADIQRLQTLLAVSERSSIAPLERSAPRPLIRAPWEEPPAERHETPTGLESLFYYPHRWYLKQQLGLYPSNLLSVTKDTTLLGNLAHRFFELLLAQPGFEQMDKTAIWDWIAAESEELLKKEGATLLLYGREPERQAFIRQVQQSAWNLVSLLRSNGWKVRSTEQELSGYFCGRPVKGKADLVLERGGELAIVDLKWSGATRRKELIQNEEDLQLVLYSYLLPPENAWPHSAYFILENSKMIARNNAAFKEAIIAGKGVSDHSEVCRRIFEKMEKTYIWRLEQFRKGLLEIRTRETLPELEAIYADVLGDLLEMKQEDARWDDYQWLLFGGG